MTVTLIGGVAIRRNIMIEITWGIRLGFNREFTALKPSDEGFPVGSNKYIPLLF